MPENKKTGKNDHLTAEDESKKQNQNKDEAEGRDPDEDHPSHAAGYIKDKKTGQWKIINPAGSKAYNYLYRNEFPDD